MQTREIKLVCHCCGVVHVKQSWFFSTPLQVGIDGAEFGKPGRTVDAPCAACDACMAADNGKPITESKVRAAFNAWGAPKCYEFIDAHWAPERAALVDRRPWGERVRAEAGAR